MRSHNSMYPTLLYYLFLFFFFNDTATTEIYTLSLHDALPICWARSPATSPPVRRHATPAASRRRRRRRQSGTPVGTRGPWSASCFDGGRRPRGLLDGRTDALVGAAAADIAGHRGVDVGIAGVRGLRHERRCRHDLARLAVPALHDLEIQPRLLHFLTSRRRADRLDGRDPLPDGSAHGCHARPGRLPVQVHGTRPAGGDAAAELCAGQADDVT